MERGAFRPAIHGSDSDENVFDIGLRVLDKNVKITVPRKNPGIEQLEFRLATPAALALLHQRFIRKCGLRILVQHSHITVRRCRIEVEVILFHVFAVIALISGQAEYSLLKDGIVSVP